MSYRLDRPLICRCRHWDARATFYHLANHYDDTMEYYGHIYELLRNIAASWRRDDTAQRAYIMASRH